eukprot:2005764-Pleurochrysis_carterae.AAC.1
MSCSPRLRAVVHLDGRDAQAIDGADVSNVSAQRTQRLKGNPPDNVGTKTFVACYILICLASLRDSDRIPRKYQMLYRSSVRAYGYAFGWSWQHPSEQTDFRRATGRKYAYGMRFDRTWHGSDHLAMRELTCYLAIAGTIKNAPMPVAAAMEHSQLFTQRHCSKQLPRAFTWRGMWKLHPRPACWRNIRWPMA